MIKKKEVGRFRESLLTASLFTYLLFIYHIMNAFFRVRNDKIEYYVDNLSSANGRTFERDDGTTKTIRKYSRRALSKIERVVVHHTATKTRSDSYRPDKHWTPEQLNDLHQDERGWDRVGYYALVYPDGSAFIVNDLKTVSYHAGGGKNTSSAGIAFVGNFVNGEKPTNEAYKTFSLLYYDVIMQLGRKVPIEPHKKFMNTSCPAGVNWEMLNDKLYERKFA